MQKARNSSHNVQILSSKSKQASSKSRKSALRNQSINLLRSFNNSQKGPVELFMQGEQKILQNPYANLLEADDHEDFKIEPKVKVNIDLLQSPQSGNDHSESLLKSSQGSRIIFYLCIDSKDLSSNLYLSSNSVAHPSFTSKSMYAKI